MKSHKLIIIDECVDFEIVRLLRINDFPILSILESNPGIKDIEVLEITVKNKAFLLTEDKDFGELVYRLNLPHTGIMLIRFSNDFDQDYKAELVCKVVLEKFEEIDNWFSVLDEHKLRIKK